jgi:hypothetical protein
MCYTLDMKQESNTKLTPAHKNALVEQRNHLISVCLKQGYTPSEVSFLFNISKQLINNIKQKYVRRF